MKKIAANRIKKNAAKGARTSPTTPSALKMKRVVSIARRKHNGATIVIRAEGKRLVANLRDAAVEDRDVDVNRTTAVRDAASASHAARRNPTHWTMVKETGLFLAWATIDVFEPGVFDETTFKRRVAGAKA